MNKEFVPYKIALELKELGFDEPCFGYYDCERDFKMISNKTNFLGCEVAIPLYQQAFRWFREEGFLIDFSSHDKDIHEFYLRWSPNKLMLSNTYKTYEEAELACLIKLIEIVKKK